MTCIQASDWSKPGDEQQDGGQHGEARGYEEGVDGVQVRHHHEAEHGQAYGVQDLHQEHEQEVGDTRPAGELEEPLQDGSVNTGLLLVHTDHWPLIGQDRSHDLVAGL